MKRFCSLLLLGMFITISAIPRLGLADSTILSPEENLWLKSRNNTIVVYPEKNFPPYSYQNSSGAPQGLSIDYIELIASKIGVSIQYLPARPLSQIFDDVKQNKKGDVVVSVTYTKDREDFLYFSDNFITVPAVIVVRKDLDKGHTLTLSDLSGKKVAISREYAVEGFIRTNNPRIVIESVVDDESGLQQVVLGEVDAAIMDIASLSHYLSKQVLNSVKVVGSTGFEYKPAFGVPKDKEMLQSILDKGLQQISTNERQTLADKWVVLPNEKVNNSVFSGPYSNSSMIIIYILLCIVILIIILLLKHRRSHFQSRYFKKKDSIHELQDEIRELESTSESLMEELKDVKNLETDIKEKIKNIDS